MQSRKKCLSMERMLRRPPDRCIDTPPTCITEIAPAAWLSEAVRPALRRRFRLGFW